MNVRRSSALNVVATGLLVLLVTLLVLFWARWGCESARHGLLPQQAWWLDIDASGLAAYRVAQDSNNVPCLFRATPEWREPSTEGLGAVQYLNAHMPDAHDSPAYLWSTDDTEPKLYYDRSIGMVVYHFTVSISQPNGGASVKKVVAYAGPEGIADRTDKKLGRFSDPIVRLIRGNLDRPIVYDGAMRRFFAIEWRHRVVKQGLPLPRDLAAPVDFAWPRKQLAYLDLYLDTPDPHYIDGSRPDRTVVLDAAGNIRMLDLSTLEYTSSVGRLPTPDTLFPSVRRATPDDLFAYQVLPVFWAGGDQGDLYAGCAVAVLSRDTTAMRLEVFDANGASIAMQQSTLKDPFQIAGSIVRDRPVSTVAALYSELPGAAALTATKFILESLHPPALLWLSYFTASSVEATAGHQSLFVLPNSFAAMKGRDTESWWPSRLGAALPFLLPGMVLGMLLAAAIGRDARQIGLPVRARRLWMAATTLFAVPAYVTYRITRPATSRVTCQNCGRDRWADWEKCHHCGSPWLVPELVPPAWRVIGQPEDQSCNDPSCRSEETISNT